MIDCLSEEVVAGVTTKDAMIAIGIDKLTEILIGLYQRLNILCRVLIMNIIVGQTRQAAGVPGRPPGDTGPHGLVAGQKYAGSHSRTTAGLHP